MIPLEGDREETYTFDNYSWTEHISRKTGQWLLVPEDLLEPLPGAAFTSATRPTRFLLYSHLRYNGRRLRH